MSSSKNFKRWLVAALASTTITSGVVGFACSIGQAGSPEPLQRIGRFVGAGWGDGYHACEPSGFRPLANLPPKSYYQKFEQSGCGGRSACASGTSCGNAVSKFYRSNGRSCDGAECDAACDDDSMNLPADTIPAESSGMQWPTDQVWTEAPESNQSLQEPVPATEFDPIGARIDLPEGSVETLPAPKAKPPAKVKAVREATPKAGKQVDVLSNGSPDTPKATDSTMVISLNEFLAADLHESQMRPIRPLPPQPKRELSRPIRPKSQQDSSELLMPQQLPSLVPPAKLRESVTGQSISSGTFQIGRAEVQRNPFVGANDVESGTNQRPSHLGRSPGQTVSVDPAHRVAEVPEWLIVKQPR